MSPTRDVYGSPWNLARFARSDWRCYKDGDSATSGPADETPMRDSQRHRLAVVVAEIWEDLSPFEQLVYILRRAPHCWTQQKIAYAISGCTTHQAVSKAQQRVLSKIRASLSCRNGVLLRGRKHHE